MNQLIFGGFGAIAVLIGACILATTRETADSLNDRHDSSPVSYTPAMAAAAGLGFVVGGIIFFIVALVAF